MAHRGEEGVEAEAGVEAGVEEAMKWQVLSTMDLMVVGAGAVVVAEAGVGAVVGTEVEAESKMPVVMMSPLSMDLQEVGEPNFLRRCHIQVAAEGGAEAEVREEVREEGIAQTDLLKINLRRELPRGISSDDSSPGIICLEVAL